VCCFVVVVLGGNEWKCLKEEVLGNRGLERRYGNYNGGKEKDNE
jgi:hypothetical protein